MKQATLNKMGVKPQATQIKTTIAKRLNPYISLDEFSDGLDFGAGLCHSTHGEKELGLESYEPFPKKGVKPTYTKLYQINKRFSFILCTYVLNVVAEDERIKILKSIRKLLKPNGRVIVVVRGEADFKKTITTRNNNYFMKKAGVTTFQHGFTLDELLRLCEKAGFVANKLGGSTGKSIRVSMGLTSKGK